MDRRFSGFLAVVLGLGVGVGVGGVVFSARKLFSGSVPEIRAQQRAVAQRVQTGTTVNGQEIFTVRSVDFLAKVNMNHLRLEAGDGAVVVYAFDPGRKLRHGDLVWVVEERFLAIPHLENPYDILHIAVPADKATP